MIHQISPVKTKTGLLPSVNKGLLQARHIQARLKGHSLSVTPTNEDVFWSPFTAGPFVVPVSRWVE